MHISAVAPALLLLSSLLCFAQNTGQNAQSGSDATYTLSIRSQLVIEGVTVKDKQGNPVHGLTAKDFTLTENGTTQNLRICDPQILPIDGASPSQPKDKEEITIYNRLTRTQIASEHSDALRYKDRRLIALYFDFTTMQPVDQYRALTAAEKFVRTQMTEVDLVSLLRYGGGTVDVLQDFSSNRNKLLSILQTLAVGEGQGSVDSVQDASSADTGAAFGQNDAEFNIFNTDRQLSALQTAAQMLGQLSEKKVLIYFAGGLRLNGVDNQAQLHATIDSALRAGVTFWPIDARGLVAEAPLGDATQGSPGNEGVYTGAASEAVQSQLQRSQDTLYALASDTGGKALLNNNDLGRGIRYAQASISDYYILGYYATNSALDGKFRRVKVSVGNPDWKLEYRQGYYAGKEFGKFTAADKERQLEDALMLDEPITELPIAMELNYFQLNRAEYFVPITIKIPGREIALPQKNSAEYTVVDFVGEVKDAYTGRTMTNVRDNVKVRLNNGTDELAFRPIEYETGFTLLPGKYQVKILARNSGSGRIGTYQTAFEIPNLAAEKARVPISTVVLSSQLVKPNDALYNVQKGNLLAKELAANPLVINNHLLIPSVTRVFRKGRPLFVYLQAYEDGGHNEPLVAYVSLFKDGRKQIETLPLLSQGEHGAQKTAVPFHFTVNLQGLSNGDYDCQVTVLAPLSARSQFWRGPLRLVP